MIHRPERSERQGPPRLNFHLTLEKPAGGEVSCKPARKTDRSLAVFTETPPIFFWRLSPRLPAEGFSMSASKESSVSIAARAISSFKGTEIPVLLSRGMEKTRSLFEKRKSANPRGSTLFSGGSKPGCSARTQPHLPRCCLRPAPSKPRGSPWRREQRKLIGMSLCKGSLESVTARWISRKKEGTCSVRGSIVDLFSPGSRNPRQGGAFRRPDQFASGVFSFNAEIQSEKHGKP